jgi:glucose-6-phosphate 1-dehydrogenase
MLGFTLGWCMVFIEDRYKRKERSRSNMSHFNNTIMFNFGREIGTWTYRSGVSIYLMSGKKLAKRTTDIIVQFKNLENSLLQELCPDLPPNRLLINIQPEGNIRMILNSAIELKSECPAPIQLNFDFTEGKFKLRGAYENALKDLYNSDRSLFLSSQEILASWRFIDGVLAQIKKDRKDRLNYY